MTESPRYPRRLVRRSPRPAAQGQMTMLGPPPQQAPATGTRQPASRAIALAGDQATSEHEGRDRPEGSRRHRPASALRPWRNAAAIAGLRALSPALSRPAEAAGRTDRCGTTCLRASSTRWRSARPATASLLIFGCTFGARSISATSLASVSVPRPGKPPMGGSKTYTRGWGAAGVTGRARPNLPNRASWSATPCAGSAPPLEAARLGRREDHRPPGQE